MARVFKIIREDGTEYIPNYYKELYLNQDGTVYEANPVTGNFVNLLEILPIYTLQMQGREPVQIAI